MSQLKRPSGGEGLFNMSVKEILEEMRSNDNSAVRWYAARLEMAMLIELGEKSIGGTRDGGPPSRSDVDSRAAESLASGPGEIKARVAIAREGVEARLERARAKGWILPPAGEFCPGCGEEMPKAHRDRRVTRKGTVVCGKASCAEREGK